MGSFCGSPSESVIDVIEFQDEITVDFSKIPRDAVINKGLFVVNNICLNYSCIDKKKNKMSKYFLQNYLKKGFINKLLLKV